MSSLFFYLLNFGLLFQPFLYGTIDCVLPKLIGDVA